MTRLHLAAAALALGIAVPGAGAASASRWLTEPGMIRSAKAHGVTLNDGSRVRVAAAICNGQGPRQGTLARPLYSRFRCQLVVRRNGGTAWYDARVFPLTAFNWAVVLSRY